MQDFDTTSTQSLIDRYYEEEKAQREIEQTLAALTMRLDANDLAMLNVMFVMDQMQWAAPMPPL